MSMSTTTEEATMGGADAFKIGIAFVKQYYKTLSSHPELLENFYSPTADAYLSHAEGSEPTQPVPPAGTDHKVVWGCGAGETMLFEFEDGAIDAQPSANKGILLVVTAVVIFTVRETGEARRRKFVQTFFLAKIGRNFAVLNDILRFLVATPEITIAATATATTTATATSLAAAAAAATEVTISTSTGEPVVVEESSSVGASVEQPVGAAAAAASAVAAKEEEPSKPKISQPPAIVEEKEVEVVEEKAVEGSVSESTDEASAPGGGVEETKEEAPEEEEASAQTNGAAAVSAGKKRSSSKEGKGKKNKGGKQQQQQQQQQQKQQPAPTASKPTPGSWASLVVSGSAPNTPSRTAVQEKRTAANNTSKTASKTPPLPPSDKKDAAKSKENGESTGAADDKTQEKDKANTTTTTTTTNTKSNAPGAANKDKAKLRENTARDQRTKRDPDNTLVIKNLSDNVKEQDIINMFQPFATMTKAKIVGTNVNHHRNLAFVDYDSVAPVLAALKKHKETPFEWNGKVLEVDQKTLEQRARRKAGGNNNPNNHNANGYRPAEGKAGRGQNGYRPGGPNPGRGGDGGSGGGGDDKFNKGGNAGGRRRGTRAGR